MAQYSKLNPKISKSHKAIIVSWVLTVDDPIGSPFPSAAVSTDRTVHIFGVFDGAIISLEGSNECDTPSFGVTLSQNDGVPLKFTTSDIKVIASNPLQIWPEMSGGTVDTVVTVKLLVITQD